MRRKSGNDARFVLADLPRIRISSHIYNNDSRLYLVSRGLLPLATKYERGSTSGYWFSIHRATFRAALNQKNAMPSPYVTQTTFTLDSATFTVPGRTLLQPLSLTFLSGKVCGLIGHNGSGKSTLLKMLGRHHAPTAGQIWLNGQALANWPVKLFAREVAYLPQQLPHAEGMTVQELVSMGRYPWHGALGGGYAGRPPAC